MAQSFDELLIGRLFQHCRRKTGSEPSTTFGKQHPSFHVLGGFLKSFADFFLDESPVCLLLRCHDEQITELQSAYGIGVSHRMHWGGADWKWVDVPLDGRIPEAILLQLLDASYKLVVDGLDKQELGTIEILQQNLGLSELLTKMFEKHDLTHRRAELEPLLRTAIFLRTQAIDETQLRLGQSKIGGVPDLPIGWAYPAFEGKSLAFLAQLNLAEIPPELDRQPLPETGILYFFSTWGRQNEVGDLLDSPYEKMGAAGFTQVLYFSGDESTLKRAERPQGIRTFKAASITYFSQITFPSGGEWWRDPVLAEMGWTDDEFERLDDLRFDFAQVYGTTSGLSGWHQLLGYASPIQSSVTQPDSELLFEVGSDYDNCGMMWADGGSIYFVIPKADLARLDFSRVTSDFQSG